MKIDKSVRAIPWPDPFEGDIVNQNFRVTLDFPVVAGEQLLVATFCRNLKNNTKPWKKEYGPDFRLVAVNTEARRDLRFVYKDDKPGVGRRRNLREIMQANFDTSPGYCYPEISDQDEEALAAWLGVDRGQTRNHLMDELDSWTYGTIERAKAAEAAKRGDIDDREVYQCPEALPDGLTDYVRRVPLREDRTLLYKRGNVRGVCFMCGRKVQARRDRFKQGHVITCPDCGEQVLAVLEGGASFGADYVENVVAMQRGEDGQTVFLRQWHIRRDPTARWEKVEDWLEETAHYAIRGNCVAKWQHEAKENWYMSSYRYRLDDWQRMKDVTRIYDGSYYFFLPDDWREILAGTSLQYCDLAGYMASMVEGETRHDLNPARLLIDWARYPAIEKFWKAGYTTLVKQRERSWGGGKKNCVRWKRASIQDATPFPFRLLKRLYAPEEWTMEKVIRAAEVWKLVKAGRVKETEAPLLVYLDGGTEAFEAALGHAPVQKILDYIDGQREKAAEVDRREKAKAERDGGTYYGNHAAAVGGTYRDYLADCGRLGLNLDDRAVLFPPDLDAAHARTIAQVKYKKNDAARKKFMETVKKLGGLCWERDGLLIRPAMTPDELTAEGTILHHCVGGYVERMADGKTTILFVRRAEAPDVPFFTLEWKDGAVIQCRTLHNRSYDTDPAVYAFVAAWVKRQQARTKRSKKAAAAAVVA